jgi:hypothetical protein
MCDASHTVWPRYHGKRRVMNYLSDLVNEHSMLRVSGEILLAFCCAAPLVLLFCFLV